MAFYETHQRAQLKNNLSAKEISLSVESEVDRLQKFGCVKVSKPPLVVNRLSVAENYRKTQVDLRLAKCKYVSV